MSGISSAGRRYGHVAAKAALFEPSLSRISEESVVKGGGDGGGGGGGGGGEVDTVEKVRALAIKTVENRLGVACLVFLVTAVLLCVVNPPMAQTTPSVDSTTTTRSIQKILMWSSLAGTVTLLLPYGMCLVKKGS